MPIRSKIYLVTVEQFKEETATNGYTTDFDNKINVAIYNAQKRLKSILCDKEYNSLLSNFDAASLTTAQTNLLPYTQEFVVWEAYKLFIPVSGVHSTEAGYRNFEDENSNQVNKATLHELSAYADEQSNYFKGELKYFLDQNIDDYPDYKESGCYNCLGRENYTKISGAGKRKTLSRNLYPDGYNHNKNRWE